VQALDLFHIFILSDTKRLVSYKSDDTVRTNSEDESCSNEIRTRIE